MRNLLFNFFSFNYYLKKKQKNNPYTCTLHTSSPVSQSKLMYIPAPTIRELYLFDTLHCAMHQMEICSICKMLIYTICVYTLCACQRHMSMCYIRTDVYFISRMRLNGWCEFNPEQCIATIHKYWIICYGFLHFHNIYIAWIRGEWQKSPMANLNGTSDEYGR